MTSQNKRAVLVFAVAAAVFWFVQRHGAGGAL